MKIQTITMFVVLTGFVGSTVTTAEANDVLKAIQNIQTLNKEAQSPKFVPPGNVSKPLGLGKFVKLPKPKLPKPVPPGPPVPPAPPVGGHHDFGLIINLPNPLNPHPGHVKPIDCKPPVNVCPLCHHQHCHCQKPPVNKPPMKKFIMKLLNNADTKLFFSINGLDYQLLEADGVELVKSLSPKPHRIAFHNGNEVVEFDLDPTAIYSFEWEEHQLMLYEIEG